MALKTADASIARRIRIRRIVRDTTRSIDNSDTTLASGIDANIVHGGVR
jgi:hypothetical protein